VVQLPQPGQSVLEIQGFSPVRCSINGRRQVGEDVHVSIRPEKFQITNEQPRPDEACNLASGTVEDVIYVGSHTRFRVRIGESRLTILQQQTRFLQENRPIRANEKVWVRWHWQDGFVVEG